MSSKIVNSDSKNKHKRVSQKTSSSKKRKSSRRKSSRKKVFMERNDFVLISGAAALVLVVLFAFGVIIHSNCEKSDAVREDISLEKSISPKKQIISQKSDNGGQTPYENPQENSLSETKKTVIKTIKEENHEKKQESLTPEVEQKQNQLSQNPKIESQKKDSTVKVKEKVAMGTDPFSIPQAKNTPKLVFVFDDAGYSTQKLQKYTNLKFPLTIAVMPKLPHSAECAEIARKAGKEVILHQPMQASNLKLNPGPGAITPGMSTFEIADTIKENLLEVGPVKGLNNHEGSLITEDIIRVGTVLDVAVEKNIYFLDSRTTAATQAPQAALERDIQILERDVFLDDVVTREDILKEIYKALDVANKRGKAIIIGHVDKSADIIPVILEEMYPQLVAKGYKVCLPSDLL